MRQSTRDKLVRLSEAFKIPLGVNLLEAPQEKWMIIQKNGATKRIRAIYWDTYQKQGWTDITNKPDQQTKHEQADGSVGLGGGAAQLPPYINIKEDVDVNALVESFLSETPEVATEDNIEDADGIGPTSGNKIPANASGMGGGPSFQVSEKDLPKDKRIQEWALSPKTQALFLERYGDAAAQELIDTAFSMVHYTAPKKTFQQFSEQMNGKRDLGIEEVGTLAAPLGGPKQTNEEGKKMKGGHPVMSRDEAKALLDAGHKLKPAGLYEPDHAPKGTEFVHVQFSPTHSEFRRIVRKDK